MDHGRACAGLMFSDLGVVRSQAAFIHVGAVLGSIMVGNVFFGIIPAQKLLLLRCKRVMSRISTEQKKPSSVHSSITTSRYQYCSA